MNNSRYKFRAWDGNCMQYFSNPFINNHDGRATDSLEMEGQESFLMDEENFILMQYTGLKDMEGKEIYESDLVIIPEQNPILEIKWDIGAFFISNNRGYRELLGGRDTLSDTLPLKVVGNIYQGCNLDEPTNLEKEEE